MCSWRYPLLKGDGEPPVHSISGRIEVDTFLYPHKATPEPTQEARKPKYGGSTGLSHDGGKAGGLLFPSKTASQPSTTHPCAANSWNGGRAISVCMSLSLLPGSWKRKGVLRRMV